MDERENLRIVLSPAGNSNSWLNVLPRYKVDREGDVINSGSELYLKVCLRQSEYVHVSDKRPKQRHQREVNCSMETTSWIMTIFRSALYVTDDSILKSHELVTLHDPENR
jgi:Inositol 1,4,5-trisphosphate/ryanodine receptor